MQNSLYQKAYFHDEVAAIKHLESIVWADGIVCPKCGVIGNAYELKGKTTRIGLKKCGACRSQFTVRVGTVFESSHIPLYKWLQATYLLSSSKKGISAHQLHRTLEVTYKSAWFMAKSLGQRGHAKAKSFKDSCLRCGGTRRELSKLSASLGVTGVIFVKGRCPYCAQLWFDYAGDNELIEAHVINQEIRKDCHNRLRFK